MIEIKEVNEVKVSDSYTVPMDYVGMLIISDDWTKKGVLVNDWRHMECDEVKEEGILKNENTEDIWYTKVPFSLTFDYSDYSGVVYGNKSIADVKAMLMTIGPHLIDGGRTVTVEVNKELEAIVEFNDEQTCLYNPAAIDLVLDIARVQGGSVDDYHVFPETLFEQVKAKLIAAGVTFE